MLEINSDNEIDVFKDAIMDENISVQVDAIKRLPLLASAVDVERTRKELIPCLVNYVDALPNEVCYNLAEQLERFVPLVGGNEYVGIILEILIKLADEEEVIVRDRAVESMRNICKNLTSEQCEQSFYPQIESLIAHDWFAAKCSAGCLIEICYTKMPQEKQTELRIHFRKMIQDDSPMVRRSFGSILVDFVPLLDPEIIKSEFIPIFDNLAHDDQDSVRLLAVDAGIAISKKLKDFEIYEYLLPTFKLLGGDDSWKVRQRIALNIYEIKMSEKNRHDILQLYKNCVRDKEAEVRVNAAKNLYNFTVNLLESYKVQPQYEDIFEKSFEENVTPEIHHMITDESDDVRVGLSSNILSLSAILRNECFNSNILPLVIDALENEEFMPFKENMLKNLNSLPLNIDITKSLKSIRNVIKNLLDNSHMHWRTRRNLLLAFTHIMRNTTSEFFDENLKIFYNNLLNDPIFAIRRTSPVILPLLIKQFGMNWAKDSLIPTFLFFSKDHRYLFRYITLFGVNELISPTLDQTPDDKDDKYLADLKTLIESADQPKKYIETLYKIVKLNEKLSNELNDEIPDDDNVDYFDNISFYAEDTLDNLKKDQSLTIFAINQNEISDDTICYLEGVLLVLVKEFVGVIKNLTKDPIKNVQDRAKTTLKNIKNFNWQIKEETQQPWVDEAIKKLTEDDLKRIEEELTERLNGTKSLDENETINCEMISEETDTKDEETDTKSEETDTKSGKTEE